MAQATKVAIERSQLLRIRRVQARQGIYRWGPEYQAAIRAVRGEVPAMSGSGTLPSQKLGREINALSWPEKAAAALGLYHPGVFEMQDQHVYYPSAMQHPFAHHALYSEIPWPATQGTFSIAEQLDLQKWHPKAWDAKARTSSTYANESDDAETALGAWEIGAWLGDFLVFLKDERGAYILFWEVKVAPEDHGKPGGAPLKRQRASAVEKARAREVVCSAYAEQLGSRVVEFSSRDIPRQLAVTLISLCRGHIADINLPNAAIAELMQAYQEAVGSDVPARFVAKKLVSSEQDLIAAKALLEVAVWHRKVRVDLYQPVLWDRPLLAERVDVLVEFAHLFAR